MNLPENFYFMKERHPFCWHVKERHTPEGRLYLILSAAKNLETRMCSIRSVADFKERSQGLLQCTVRVTVWGL
jgi:hypothetical protein